MKKVEVDENDKKAMKKAVSTFENFIKGNIKTAVSSAISSDSSESRKLIESINTSSLGNNAVKIGEYGVFPKKTSTGKTRYDVANMDTGEKILENVFLAKAAEGVVKYLNRGHNFYSREVKTILELEESYVRKYMDMLHLQKSMKSSPIKESISETKFEVAKSEALHIKEKLKNIVDLI